MALFEVWQDGHCKMGTDSAKLIYPEHLLKNMQSAGCTFKLNGKRISVKNLVEEVKNGDIR